jgi:hypothetical protein
VVEITGNFARFYYMSPDLVLKMPYRRFVAYLIYKGKAQDKEMKAAENWRNQQR